MSQTEAINDLALLEWQIAMGADETIGEEPADWFARSAEKMAQKAMQIEQAPSSPSQPVSAGVLPRPVQKTASVAKPVTTSQDNVGDARKLAQACKSIDDLIKALETFDACALSRTATNLCFIDGNKGARILMIGEAPGRDEDLQGKPFVGRSGQLLDKMLSHIGLSRHSENPQDSVLISNTVFWRPPGNRKPSEAETLMCLPFVNKLIELVAPEMIVCLGATPTQRLTGQTKGITRLRGRWFSYGENELQVPVLATLHPSYLLRQPMQKKLAWRDFISIKTKFVNIA